MRTLLSGPFPWLIGGFGFLIVAAYFWLVGSAVVVDEAHGVSSVVITNSGGNEQKVRRIWGGYYYAIPSIEGVIEVRCLNGARKQMGYVTGFMHTKVRVVGRAPCAHVVEDI